MQAEEESLYISMLCWHEYMHIYYKQFNLINHFYLITFIYEAVMNLNIYIYKTQIIQKQIKWDEMQSIFFIVDILTYGIHVMYIYVSLYVFILQKINLKYFVILVFLNITRECKLNKDAKIIPDFKKFAVLCSSF